MEEKKFLNEETYQKNNKKLSNIILSVFMIGFVLGLILITIGIIKKGEINSKYSESKKEELRKQIEEEKVSLEDTKSKLEENKKKSLESLKKLLQEKRDELNTKGIIASRKYTDGEAYDLYIVTNVLDPSFDHCAFSEYKDNIITSKYCLLSNSGDEDSQKISTINDALDESFGYCDFDKTSKNPLVSKYCSLTNQLESLNKSFDKDFESSKVTPLFIFGGFIIIAFGIICGSLYISLVKRRELLAYSANQILPVGKEIIEDVAPTIGKAGAAIGKEMAPVYGDVAKEIAKGIKEGLKDEEKNQSK